MLLEHLPWRPRLQTSDREVEGSRALLIGHCCQPAPRALACARKSSSVQSSWRRAEGVGGAGATLSLAARPALAAGRPVAGGEVAGANRGFTGGATGAGRGPTLAPTSFSGYSMESVSVFSLHLPMFISFSHINNPPFLLWPFISVSRV